MFPEDRKAMDVAKEKANSTSSTPTPNLAPLFVARGSSQSKGEGVVSSDKLAPFFSHTHTPPQPSPFLPQTSYSDPYFLNVAVAIKVGASLMPCLSTPLNMTSQKSAHQAAPGKKLLTTYNGKSLQKPLFWVCHKECCNVLLWFYLCGYV